MGRDQRLAPCCRHRRHRRADLRSGVAGRVGHNERRQRGSDDGRITLRRDRRGRLVGTARAALAGTAATPTRVAETVLKWRPLTWAQMVRNGSSAGMVR